jgi:hypothetical protein
MRAFIFAAVAGLTVGCLGPTGANAMTQTSPAGVRVATEAMDTSALVHCRPYRHWHEWEHRRTYGCGGGGSVEIRRGHRVGVSVEERERSRTSIRSRTTTRGETSVRGSTSTKTGESTKSSTSTSGKTGTSSKSGSSGATTGRGQTGEKSSTGGSSSGGMSGSSGTSGGSSGQKQ